VRLSLAAGETCLFAALIIMMAISPARAWQVPDDYLPVSERRPLRRSFFFLSSILSSSKSPAGIDLSVGFVAGADRRGFLRSTTEQRRP